LLFRRDRRRKGGNRGGSLGRPAALGDQLIDGAAPAGFAGLRDLGLALAREAGRLVSKPAIDQRLDAVIIGKPEENRSTEI
jgi:hypothetical protein